MAIFKCKMCGGALDITDGNNIITCNYCDTKQTLPKLDNSRKTTLYDRAGHFRRRNEYDKATAIYETILNEDDTDAETYWSLVLCKYGVEYVVDPVTHRRIPTCNRTQLSSIFADENYRQAVEFADGMARSIYEEEAQAIDAIQKGILEISTKEEPFDVFICYKETGDDGQRTKDSALAHDIYHHLTKENFKVFFSRITLEKKLGHQYEPYIFAALNSAKVMLVVGTKPEHFNAVWVKNEWSRFLVLAKENRSKLLIPCYRDMDVYDLPDELSMLQSQDMSKIGFMQDLLHGIKKVLTESNHETRPLLAATVHSGHFPTTNALLKRAFIFLEDGDFKQADEYCERVLDADPENARAYIGKLCAELKIHFEEDLPNIKGKAEKKAVEYPDVLELAISGEHTKAAKLYREKVKQQVGLREAIEYIEAMLEDNQEIIKTPSLSEYNNYKKALRFADSDYRKKIEGYEQIVQERIQKENDRIAEMKLQKENQLQYSRLLFRKRSTRDGVALKALAEEFRNMSGYKDTTKLADECERMIEEVRDRQYQQLVSAKDSTSDYKGLLSLSEKFRDISGHKNADSLAKECERMANYAQKACQQLEEADKIKAQEEQRKREQSERWVSQGLCRYCGGGIGGLFTKKCKSCGKAK